MAKRKSTPARAKGASRAASDDGALDLALELMAIPGASGDETEVAQFVIDRLLAAGAKKSWIQSDAAHRRTPIDGQRGNLCLKIPGRVRGPRRLLMAHLDTVPICVGSRPVRKGKRIRSADATTGLGADDRAGVAVTLHTALQLLQGDLAHPPLTFLWSVQEEIGLHGARNVRKAMLGNPQLAFNWDGGAADKMTVGATGGYRMRIDVRGRASHAGNAPEAGISAIAIASLAIAELVQLGWHGDIQKNGKHGTSNIGVIQGGAATNVVTDHVLLKVEARSHDAVFRKRIVREIEAAFRRAVKQVKSSTGAIGKVQFDGRLDYESFRMEMDEPSVAAASAAIRAAGGSPLPAITNGGLDANWMVAHGIPTVTLGCGQLHQHTVDEALDIGEFQRACRIAWILATDGG